MDTQNIIVALIILAAFVYAGKMLGQKLKSFKPRVSSCGIDCGCGAKEENKAAKIG